MTWYAAHIIIGFHTGQSLDKFSAYENITLLEAESFEEAADLANKIGQEEADLDDDLTIDGIPGKRIFAGVRKILTISNYSGDQNRDPPSQRSEISYSEFKVESLEDLMKLGSGEEVDLTYLR